MCGITGWFDTRGEKPPDRALIKLMTDAIAHRGPDGEGYHFAPGLALGHRRLAVIDLATGDQPMFNRSRKVAIVFNGEIYNFHGLRRELALRGHIFSTRSDTEVIIAAWEEWGEACVEHLTGMFAFAVWDQPKQTLFLARDRLGEKPLYYSVLSDGVLVFGSELKALLVHPDLEREIDPCAVEEFFALGYIAEPRTIYRNVLKLPAGTCLSLTRGGSPNLRSYWDLRASPSVSRSANEIADELLSRLETIVRSQLISDVPIGTFLSGGVDSSGVTALGARQSASPIESFTIGFDDRRFDETEHAVAVANRYSLKHVVRRMTLDDTGDVSRFARIFDEPFGDSSALPTLLLMQLARQNVTVALSGDAGDELFAGYRRYLFHAREEYARKLLPPALRYWLFGALSRVYPQLDWAPRALRARHTLRELSLDSPMGFFWNVSVTDDETRSSLFTADFRRALKGYHASDVISRYWQHAPDRDAVATAQYVDLKTWLPGDILTKVDRTAMACSLEVRVPMLDHHFVEWAFSLPREMKIRHGAGKFILKHAFERLVPRDVLYRPKQGFSVPLAKWFRGALGETFGREVVGKNGLVASGCFEGPVIEGLADQHRSGLRDHSRVLWLLWNFQNFLTQVHGKSPARVHAPA